MLRRATRLFLSGQFGRFLVAGGFAAAANFLSRFAFEPFFGFWGAVVAAYGVGVSTAFCLNKRFVFPASGKPVAQEMAWFLVFNAIAFPIVVVASILLYDHVFGGWMPDDLAKAVSHGVAIIIPVFINFVAHKFVTFAATDPR